MRTGQVTTTYCNEFLFRLLDVTPIDLYFKPLDRLIDAHPHNVEFWSVIKEHRSITNKNMTLCLSGKKVDCIITSKIYNQRTLNVKGVQFFITTQKQISANVSEKISNSAVRTFSDFIGQSNKVKSTIQNGKIMAQTHSNVMLLGESGVGKDVLAQAIHNAGPRRNKPFVAVNCGALPRDIIASELFGYEGGAFTGAKREGNIGKFELANGGTIFLDEIGEMPLDLQATLLRVVEQKQLMRIGGNKLINVDVRVISATNADMMKVIEQKRFRSDLYYRLSTMILDIPPLRERDEDIILLAAFY
ncbi:sigma 54-interacting transcriptional regulator [Lachnospiraceae bacterium ZAX-1]